MLLSIVTVYKDDFKRLLKTIDSIIKQKTSSSVQHHIQMSSASAVELMYLRKLQQISPSFYTLTYSVESDKSIYEGMNHSLKHLQGLYVSFINCGDRLISENSLTHLYSLLQLNDSHDPYDLISLCFGYDMSPGKWNVCGYKDLRRSMCDGALVCQQSLLYSARYLVKNPFDLRYRYAADYKHTLYMLSSDISLYQVPYAFVEYEPGGVSESLSHKVAEEIREIRSAYA